MRRTPLLGLLLFSLLGFSGCAGVSRQLDWSSPSTDRADTPETPAPKRFSWWRRPRAEAPASDSAGDLAQVNRAGQSPIATKVPGDVWPEPKPNWQVRYFPHLSRLWNGNTTRNTPDAEPGPDVVRVSSRSRPPAASYSRRADDDVRPVDASADDDIASRERSTAAEKGERFAPPLVPTPLLGRSPTPSQPEGTSDVELDVSKVDPGRARPARSDALDTPVNQREWASSSTNEATPVVATASGDKSPSETSETPAVVTESGLPSDAIANSAPEPVPDMELAQAPAPPAPSTQPQPAIPPPPPLNRTPPPPPLTDEEKPAAKPGQPAASPAPKLRTSQNLIKRRIRSLSRPPLRPRPRFPRLRRPRLRQCRLRQPLLQRQRSGPRLRRWPQVKALVYASGQAVYASPPPMAPPRPRSRFLSLFLEEEKAEPLASPQFPAATFPTAYYGAFPRPYPVAGAPQVNEAKPAVATRSAKKPCVLTVWFQKITSGRHASGCTGCHHARPGPCCSGCTCYARKDQSAGASPQRTIASPQSTAASPRGPRSQATPIGSTGPKPGDVAEEGKLFERVSSESFDKSPQS